MASERYDSEAGLEKTGLRLNALVAAMTKQNDGKTERVDIKVPIKGAAIIAFGGKVTPTLTREF